MTTNLSASIAPKTVLVVEDSPTEAKNIRAVLTEAGLRVVWAVNGLDGLQKAQEIHPDLIVMDVNMPGMNGFQVVQALKHNPQYAAIPIVMLTTNDGPESVLTGFDSGAIDYIPKDVFAMHILVETIRQMGLIQ
jgi:twitching motility two-component system response regulator PilH